MFDKLYVVVATADGKDTMFDLEQRKAMMLDLIPEDYWRDDCQDPQIEVITLPKGVYLATFAKKLGADFLVRGLRDAFDFHYEHQIYQTNRRIETEVETIYIMPDAEMQMVSSSWVKTLIGHYGWRKAVRPYVSEDTLRLLALKYAKQRCKALMESHVVSNMLTAAFDFEIFWNKFVIEDFHEQNAYHNVFHILDCLEAMDYYAPQDDPAMELAFWLHDLKPDPEDCVIMASQLLVCNAEIGDKIVRLIRATKHTETLTGKLPTEEEQIMASIDLLPLGYSSSRFRSALASLYDEYKHSVFNEYKTLNGEEEREFFAKWVKGRIDFMKAMLARDQIFPWKTLRNQFEGQAKSNMGDELRTLEGLSFSS